MKLDTMTRQQLQEMQSNYNDACSLVADIPELKQVYGYLKNMSYLCGMFAS